jgi:hypothetical protein
VAINREAQTSIRTNEREWLLLNRREEGLPILGGNPFWRRQSGGFISAENL